MKFRKMEEEKILYNFTTSAKMIGIKGIGCKILRSFVRYLNHIGYPIPDGWMEDTDFHYSDYNHAISLRLTPYGVIKIKEQLIERLNDFYIWRKEMLKTRKEMQNARKEVMKKEKEIEEMYDYFLDNQMNETSTNWVDEMAKRMDEKAKNLESDE